MAHRPFRSQLSALLHSLDSPSSPVSSQGSGSTSPHASPVSTVSAELSAIADRAKLSLRATLSPPPGVCMLERLLAENAQFVAGIPKTQPAPPALRQRLAAEGQHPAAAVVACADSLVCPELIFRAGIGELFVIRAAGNTTWGDEVLGSLEYAVEHLHVELVMVLGHNKCGAVGAACAGGDPLPGALGRHVAAIARAVELHGGLTKDVDVAIRRNVAAAVAALRKNPAGCVATAERKRGLVVRGAVYDVQSGAVTVLDEDGGEGLATKDAVM